MHLCLYAGFLLFTDWSVTQSVLHYYMTTEGKDNPEELRYDVQHDQERTVLTVRSGFSRNIVPESSTVLTEMF